MQANSISAIYAGLCTLLLIVDSSCALLGARSGVEICVRTVIPSLFPFFILSIIITSSLKNCNLIVMKKLAQVMRIPQSSAAVLIPAFLGGYPVGAKCVADLYRHNVLNKQDAERLLAFCNNAGPAFLFGMVSAYFPSQTLVWKLWFIHIMSAIVTSLLFPANTQGFTEDNGSYDPEATSEVMAQALKAIALVCGWVVLFRIVIEFINKWILWMFPQWIQVLISGILELSNGCCELLRIENISLRFILCSCMLSFGGICVLFQTSSVVKGLSLHNYIAGKIIQTVTSYFLCLIVIRPCGTIFAALILLILICLVNFKNLCGKSKFFPV